MSSSTWCLRTGGVVMTAFFFGTVLLAQGQALAGGMAGSAKGAKEETCRNRAETGMSLGQWLSRQKLLEALKLVAAGESVKTIAMDLGYNSPSAFVAMFRRELGQTPKRYFRT